MKRANRGARGAEKGGEEKEEVEKMADDGFAVSSDRRDGRMERRPFGSTFLMLPRVVNFWTTLEEISPSDMDDDDAEEESSSLSLLDISLVLMSGFAETAYNIPFQSLEVADRGRSRE